MSDGNIRENGISDEANGWPQVFPSSNGRSQSCDHLVPLGLEWENSQMHNFIGFILKFSWHVFSFCRTGTKYLSFKLEKKALRKESSGKTRVFLRNNWSSIRPRYCGFNRARPGWLCAIDRLCLEKVLCSFDIAIASASIVIVPAQMTKIFSDRGNRNATFLPSLCLSTIASVHRVEFTVSVRGYWQVFLRCNGWIKERFPSPHLNKVHHQWLANFLSFFVNLNYAMIAFFVWLTCLIWEVWTRKWRSQA